MAIELKTAAFKPTVLNAGKPVLVDFWAPWCGPCRTQLPIIEEISESVGPDALVAKVNIDEEPEVARMMNVRSIPTLLVFKGNKILNRFVGLTSREQLMAALRAADAYEA